NRRRLRVEQARERRAKAEAEAAAGTDPVVAERTAREVEEEEGLDLGSLEVEVGELLRFATGAAALLGVAAIWRNFFPALAALREVWEVKDAAGTSVFSLYSLGTAVLAAALTWVLAKRLPGLLEFTVLNRFKLGRGERYAIRAVVTYVLTAVGTLVTLGLLGVRWANVQWLAAAVSVGLGFGLQEIFANFVSGLILLFERPIRVGDLVTVAGIEGRVTEIRIRATTILDYDRREMVVPNREFVTGSLVNWTLSDPITRLVVNVGIAYGSDVETARDLMRRAAQECKLVLRDPAPRIVFRGFGDSSLDFEVRVFMTDRDQWPVVVDFLHERIDLLFREHEIEIPFPQRDLHLRSAAPGLIEDFGRPRPLA
ncbi:MAG: mechanosensitive ion channel domain-containing protein, partial [Planctomycetota bacterium]